MNLITHFNEQRLNKISFMPPLVGMIEPALITMDDRIDLNALTIRADTIRTGTLAAESVSRLRMSQNDLPVGTVIFDYENNHFYYINSNYERVLIEL